MKRSWVRFPQAAPPKPQLKACVSWGSLHALRRPCGGGFVQFVGPRGELGANKSRTEKYRVFNKPGFLWKVCSSHPSTIRKPRPRRLARRLPCRLLVFARHGRACVPQHPILSGQVCHVGWCECCGGTVNDAVRGGSLRQSNWCDYAWVFATATFEK